MVKKKVASIIASMCVISSSLVSYGLGSESFNLPVYKSGTEHEDVKVIQKALQKDGLFDHSKITEYYGPITEGAVEKFQQKHGLAADGVVGKTTIEKMEELGLFTYGKLTQNLYKKDMDNKDIEIIQKALKYEGVYKNDFHTTFFGGDTEEAVKAFQSKYGLTADGVVGKTTIEKMEELGLVTHSESAAESDSVLGNLSLSVYKKGMKHQDIKIIQKSLNRLGLFNEENFTINFGTVTEAAVKAFQQKYGLEADGVAGESTIQKMKSLGLITHKPVSRSSATSRRGYGEYLSWYSQIDNKIIKPGDLLEVKDLNTGKTFKVIAVAGSDHMDVETASAEDTKIMKNIWGGSFSWDRRAVVVYTSSGKALAGSLNGMPHAGRDDKPYGQNVSNRSQGYGYGYNLDKVKNNNMSGVICLHFKGSTLHKNNAVDSKHQYQVKRAAGLAK